MFRRLFSRNRGPLKRAHDSRLKHYSSGGGYHYEYRYEGSRSYGSRSDSGTEFVFRISAGCKASPTARVFLSTGVLRAWEERRGREFSATERYAIAKMALFQAFDERAAPAEMGEPVLVRTADLDAIAERLNLE